MSFNGHLAGKVRVEDGADAEDTRKGKRVHRQMGEHSCCNYFVDIEFEHVDVCVCSTCSCSALWSDLF